MANPLHQSIDEQFSKQNYNQPNWGVKNAQLDQMTAGVSRGNAANTPNKPSRRFANETLNQYQNTDNQDADSDDYSPENVDTNQEQMSDAQSSTNSTKKTPNQKNTTTNVLAHARSVPFAVAINSAAFTLWPIQFLIAVFSFSLLGMSSQVAESWTLSTIDSLIKNTGWLVGFESIDLQAMAFTGFYLQGFISFTLLFLSLILAKIMRINPLFGGGAALKTSFFLVAIIFCFIPLIPSTILWSWAIILKPK
jgi:hypothetical protein